MIASDGVQSRLNQREELGSTRFSVQSNRVSCHRLGRNCIGIALNPTYAEMAARRIRDGAGIFAEISA